MQILGGKMGKLKERLREEAEQEQLLYIEQYRAMVRAYANGRKQLQENDDANQKKSKSWDGGRLGTKTVRHIQNSFSQKGNKI